MKIEPLSEVMFWIYMGAVFVLAVAVFGGDPKIIGKILLATALGRWFFPRR